MTLAMFLLILFPVYALASSLWSEAPSTSLASALVLLLVSLILAASQFLPRRLLLTLNVLVPLLASLCFLIVASSFATKPIANSPRVYTVLFDGPVAAGSTVAIFALLIVSGPIITMRIGTTIGVAVVAMATIAVSWTGSRAPMLALAVGLIVLVAQRRRTSSFTLLGTFIATALLASAAPLRVSGPYLSPLSRLWSEDLGPSSGRFEIWIEALRFAKERPLLGSGFDTTQGLSIDMAHNVLLTVLGELGIIGLILGLAYATVLLLRLHPSPTMNPYLPPIVAIAVLSLFDSFLFGWKSPVAMASWIAIGAAALWQPINSSTRAESGIVVFHPRSKSM